jgi:hypothetical protein
MSSAQEAKASTAEAFEAFGRQFLAQFAPLPSNRKRKANEQVGGPPKKRRKEQSPVPAKEISFEHSDKGSRSPARGSGDSSENGLYTDRWHRDYTESLLPGESSESGEEEDTVDVPHAPVIVFDPDKNQKVTSQSRNGFMVSFYSGYRIHSSKSNQPLYNSLPRSPRYVPQRPCPLLA